MSIVKRPRTLNPRLMIVVIELNQQPRPFSLSTRYKIQPPRPKSCNSREPARAAVYTFTHISTVVLIPWRPRRVHPTNSPVATSADFKADSPRERGGRWTNSVQCAVGHASCTPGGDGCHLRLHLKTVGVFWKLGGQHHRLWTFDRARAGEAVASDRHNRETVRAVTAAVGRVHNSIKLEMS